jgi:type IV secretory pathway VirB2 component (pilin)
MQADAASVADRASRVIMRYARLGGAVAGAVALLGLFVTGAALLVGRAALDGTAETIWTVVGVILMLAAVAPPVIAAFSLRSVGKFGAQLVSELRSLLDSGGEASSVVIETTEVTADGNRAVVATAMPTMGRLRYQALQSGTATRLPVVLATLMRLPLLLVMAVVAMLFAAGAGFILFLIWVF